MKSNCLFYPEKEAMCTWRSPPASHPKPLHIKVGNFGKLDSAFCIGRLYFLQDTKLKLSEYIPAPRHTWGVCVGVALPQCGEFAVTRYLSQLLHVWDKPHSPQGQDYSQTPKLGKEN